MATCEDWPCCGHEAGCCPDYDESGKQLNMKCTCGATLPIDARCSICETCMRSNSDGDYYDPFEDDCFPDDDEEGVDWEEGCAPDEPEAT